MKQLDCRFYTRSEIAETLSVNINDSKHFKRNVENALSKWGYDFHYIDRQGVEILSKPEAPKEKLKELLIRCFGMDTQINAVYFAYFIDAFETHEEFRSMPWEERVRFLHQHYGFFSVDDRTLRNWCERLIKCGVIDKNDSIISYWCTYYEAGEKYRETVNDDDEHMKKYFNRRSELFQTAYKNLRKSGFPATRATTNIAWSETYNALWSEFKCCYYKCKAFKLQAVSEEDQAALAEIYELINEIVTAAPNEKHVDPKCSAPTHPATNEEFRKTWYK